MPLYTPGNSSQIMIGVYHVPVTTLSYAASSMCEWSQPLGGLGPNSATAQVKLAYPFPPDAPGLAAFPNVSLTKNGTPVGGNPSWSWDNGFILSYPEPVPLTGDLVLSLSHSQGTPVNFNPASGHVASITVSTMC